MNSSLSAEVNFDKMDGLIPAVIQDAGTDQVLMVGYMNREALDRTAAEGMVTFWSRTKRRLWQKGESSGNTLRVTSLTKDCDADALLIRVRPSGPVCHTGSHSCFGEEAQAGARATLEDLERIIRERKEAMPDGSYTAKLFARGTAAIAQKVGEEAVEVVIASLQRDRVSLVGESSDLLYHLLVLLADGGISLADVADSLRGRMKK